MEDSGIDPSKRKSLGGLDNLTASGINRFETILKLASKYRIEKTMMKLFKMVKNTLKQITKCTATLSYILGLRHMIFYLLYLMRTIHA